MKNYWIFFIFFLMTRDFFSLSASENNEFVKGERLIQDLLVVDYWNKRLNERFPMTYNHFFQGGYINMPSARMGEEGLIGLGYSHVPPYRNYNLLFQLTDRLEISGNYRIFKGFKDPVLGEFGFGDFSDKGVNVKISLFSPEESRYTLPGIAIGLDDFMGTKAFRSTYLVLTHIFLDYHLEISLGYGAHRIKKWFGGMLWMPFLKSDYSYLQGLCFTLEYDATPYQDPLIERHPKGGVKKSPWNVGLKYRVADGLDLSLAYIRGDAVAFSASAAFNFGYTKGILPKISDPLPYRAPINNQAIGFLRPEEIMVQDYICAMQDQGFDVQEVWLGYDEYCQKTLRIQICNLVYREECQVRNRLDQLLANLTPGDIDRVIIVIDTDFVLIQEYHYDMKIVRSYQCQKIGRYELSILTPMREVTSVNFFNFQRLYRRKKEWWNFELLPKTHTLFGSSRGKFKYALGLSANLNGFIGDDIFYNISLGGFFLSNLHDIEDVDRLNPSQIIHVRSDIINYFKQKTVTVDAAFIEKIWNWGDGLYSRLSIGIFEAEYGGVSAELLYYPVNSPWAIGVESALLKKRSYRGLGFTSKVRKLTGFHPTHHRFIGTPYFFNVYYDWKCLALDIKVSAGKFLANDYGVRTEVTRYFPSGLRLSFWYTYTNGHDKINGETYYDKGFYLSMPLDIFYTRSSRSRWGYGMSAWLRDVGVRAFTGTEIYYLINEQRQ
jgi:hypothetical protein